MSLPLTALLAGALASMLFVLSLRVLLLRMRLRQPLGDGGHAVLQRAVRAQANFAEHVPMLLLLFLLMEWRGLPAAALHAFAVLTLVARAVHAVGVSRLQERLAWRVVGTALTLVLLSVGAVGLVVDVLREG